jgi:cell wall-associated NlpC family hydrolase
MRSDLRRATTLLCVLFLLCASHAEARTRRRHRGRVVSLAIAPLLAAHATVHAIATAPLRVAYQTARPSRELIYDAQLEEDDDALEAEPAEMAYNTNRVHRPRPPVAERAQDFDDDDEERAPRNTQLTSGAKPTIAGSRALLRNGVAHAPANAPAGVKNAIWAANSIRNKPYVWGGGHGSFSDRGYDCSGTVSFALHNAGVLQAPLPSSDLMRFGERGRGRWITIYTRPGHTFAVIAGLRLDTTDFYRGGNVGPRWHADMRDTFGYVARHPAGL